MVQPKFLQLHTLTSYPASLLNRDDAGFAKRIPFGGASRTRVSSQCLKFHWRNFKGQHSLNSLNLPRSLRSRETFTARIAKPLIEEGYPRSLVAGSVFYLRDWLLTGNSPKRNDTSKILNDNESDLKKLLDTYQVVVLGEPEVNYLRQLVSEILEPLKEDMPEVWEEPESELTKDQTNRIWDALKCIKKGELKKNLKALTQATGLEAAMFGRMTTSDMLARSDAAVHVAHAFTTHAEESESDYFTAVDELRSESEEGELGGGHLNTTELASGLFYGYVVVDVPLLVSNIEGCSRGEWIEAERSVAASAVEKLIHLIATVSPGAKLGSTAPYSYSELLLAEWGSAQPRTLANAFRQPIEIGSRNDVQIGSYRALGSHLSDFDQMYGCDNERRLGAVGPKGEIIGKTNIERTVPVDQLASWAADKVRGG